MTYNLEQKEYILSLVQFIRHSQTWRGLWNYNLTILYFYDYKVMTIG